MSTKSLAPSYFGVVMATGIIAIGFAELDLLAISYGLLAISGVSYLILVVLYVLRWRNYPAQVGADARDPALAFGYFTVVAATSVLATAIMKVGFWLPLGLTLLGVAVLLWLVMGYVVPWLVFLHRGGAPILSQVNGTWFVWSVASQSLAVSCVAAETLLPEFSSLFGILAVLAWSIGSMLYAGIAILVMLRVIHYGVSPEQVEPSYWVAMGALAIAVVAGVGVTTMDSTPMVAAAADFIGGTVVIFWSFATWLIPILIGIGIWRHLVHKVRLRYTPALWSMVFPLGMFAVASLSLGTVDGIDVIELIGMAFLAIATATWLLVAFGGAKTFAMSAKT